MAELQQDIEKYVELRNINKTYGTFKASNNINLGIEKVLRLRIQVILLLMARLLMMCRQVSVE